MRISKVRKLQNCKIGYFEYGYGYIEYGYLECCCLSLNVHEARHCCGPWTLITVTSITAKWKLFGSTIQLMCQPVDAALNQCCVIRNFMATLSQHQSSPLVAEQTREQTNKWYTAKKNLVWAQPFTRVPLTVFNEFIYKYLLYSHIL